MESYSTTSAFNGGLEALVAMRQRLASEVAEADRIIQAYEAADDALGKARAVTTALVHLEWSTSRSNVANLAISLGALMAASAE